MVTPVVVIEAELFGVTQQNSIHGYSQDSKNVLSVSICILILLNLPFTRFTKFFLDDLVLVVGI